MVSIRDVLREAIKEALRELGIAAEDVHLEHPEVREHGDYSTNVALHYAKTAGETPRELAEAITEKLRAEKNKYIEKIEIAGSGFINFYLSSEFFTASLGEIIEKGEAYGKNAELAGKKIIIEYTDPNPFKEFHIGHLMSNAIGESLSRLIEFSGAEVKRANYQGDVGLHVAKALWGKREKPEATWGAAYAYGATKHEEDEEAKKEIQEINKKIYEGGNDNSLYELYDKGRKDSFEAFEKIYKKLGTNFDEGFYFFESEAGALGKQIVLENTPKIFERSDGAIVFRGEKYGLHTRVFVTSQGFPTYEAKELWLAKIKHDRFAYDQSIIVTGNEVRDYFKVARKAMELLFPELANKTTHITHGMLRLLTGKMSSRTGDVITAESLIEEAKKRIKEKMADADVPDKEKVAEEVAIGAIKYSILKNAPGNDIIFDFDTSLSFEGSSGPYLQYSYVRANSVLEKAKNRGTMQNPPAGGRGTTQKITGIERIMYQFPEIVSRARKENAPQHIATYLIELAQAFNAFYAEEHIADSPYRLALTEAVAIVLKNGLWILGIGAPERM